VTSIPIDDAENDALNRQQMLDLLANRKLYLFVGAGLSCRVGIPDWKALLTECVEVYREQPQHSPARVRELLSDTERACFGRANTLPRACVNCSGSRSVRTLSCSRTC